MTPARLIQHPTHLQAAKAASLALVRAAGGVEAAGSEAERSKTRISDCTNVNHADFLNIREVAALEAVTHGSPNHPQVTRWLARQTHHALVKLPEPDAVAGSIDWHQHMAKLSTEANDIVSGLCRALSAASPGGPAVVDQEARPLLTEAEALIGVAVNLAAALESVMRGGG
jgi:hypothetical protein